MKSSSIKNLLIVLLVAVNIFLLINLINTDSANQRISYETLENASMALARKGIFVEPDQIPSKKFNQSVIYVGCSLEERLSAAEKYLGTILAEYNLPNGITYQSANAYISFFNDGKFEYGLLGNHGTGNRGMEDIIYVSELSGDTRKKLKKAFSEMIAHSDERGRFSLKEIGQSETENGITVYAELMFDGLKINEGLMTFEFSENKPVYISGKYVFDSMKEFYSREYIDAPSALFLLDGDTSVEEIQMIYYPVMSDTDNYFFVPSWYIATSSGDNYIFDGVSGYER